VHGQKPKSNLVQLSDAQSGHVATFSAPSKAPAIVTFDRKELAQILNTYGKKVVAGEWRDYAIDFLSDRALFSIYARVSERPLYVIEKNPKLRAKQGQFLISAQDGRILKRGHELAQVLRVLDPDLYIIG
jgi:hypothetical protein